MVFIFIFDIISTFVKERAENFYLILEFLPNPLKQRGFIDLPWKLKNTGLVHVNGDPQTRHLTSSTKLAKKQFSVNSPKPIFSVIRSVFVFLDESKLFRENKRVYL